jgi:DNA-binding XRE family transcriptional regulator
MTGDQLRQGRVVADLTQAQAAAKLGLSQPYLSQLERGRRPVTPDLALSATRLLRLPATALPVPDEPWPKSPDNDWFVGSLAGLEYPGYGHVRRSHHVNPAHTVLVALSQDNLDARVTAALPWVFLKYRDLDWPWILMHAKLRNLQNRLGFLVSLAREVAEGHPEWTEASSRLAAVEGELELARLAAETTLCRERMPEAERKWLRRQRPAQARHWNVLTSLATEHLFYGA